VRQALIVAEVALACTLLAGAGLLMRSALYLQHVKTGFDPIGLVTARVALPEVKYKEPARALQAYHALMEQLARLPGVQSASLGSTAPLVGGDFTNGITVEGQPATDLEHVLQAASRFVVPRYLATVRIALVRGRDFTSADVAGRERVAIVSESFAERAWPNQDPIGRRFTCCDGRGNDPRWRTVVGVVGDVRADGPTAGLQPQFYLPVDQMPVEVWDWTGRAMTVVARLDRDDDAHVANVMAAIRAAVRTVDPGIPVYRMRPMRDLVRGSTAEARFNTLLLGLLGAVGLALAMVGIYGVVGYVVAQRTTEIGIRMALGATPGNVVRLLALQGTRPILVGIGVGTALAFVAMRLLRTAVYGVSLSDPMSLAGAAAMLFLAGLTAALVPAGRATRVDPARTIMRG